MPDPADVQILYISGSGRSGSTLVERLLHASPRFQGLGEFHCLWRLPAEAITCSCGTPFAGDDFWAAAMREAGVTEAVLGELRRLEAVVARSGYIARHRFDLARLAAQSDVRDFLAPQMALLAAVARLGGRQVMVDSSKAGPRAWLLATDPRVSVLHLWRDPTDVIASWRSRKYDAGLGRDMDRPSVQAAALDWWKAEQLARRLARVRPVAMFDYGALCAAPRPQLEAALAAAGIGGDSGIPWASERAVMPGDHYHSLNGNPDRFSRAMIEVTAKTADLAGHAAHERVAIPAVGGALALFYPARRG
jgi:hypothetical protein